MGSNDDDTEIDSEAVTSNPFGHLRGAPEDGSATRHPQSAVQPVIGTRPGSTGTAPTSWRGPTRNTLARPVIGNRDTSSSSPTRPAATISNAAAPRHAPRGPLIGENGVVSSAAQRPTVVRVSRSHWDSGMNRSVIPGVRQGFQPKADHDNKTSTVNRRTKSELEGGQGHDDVDEKAVVARMARRDTIAAPDDANSFWEPPDTGRGVIRGAKRPNDADEQVPLPHKLD